MQNNNLKPTQWGSGTSQSPWGSRSEQPQKTPWSTPAANNSALKQETPPTKTPEKQEPVVESILKDGTLPTAQALPQAHSSQPKSVTPKPGQNPIAAPAQETRTTSAQRTSSGKISTLLLSILLALALIAAGVFAYLYFANPSPTPQPSPLPTGSVSPESTAEATTDSTEAHSLDDSVDFSSYVGYWCDQDRLKELTVHSADPERIIFTLSVYSGSLPYVAAVNTPSGYSFSITPPYDGFVSGKILMADNCIQIQITDSYNDYFPAEDLQFTEVLKEPLFDFYYSSSETGEWVVVGNESALYSMPDPDSKIVGYTDSGFSDNGYFPVSDKTTIQLADGPSQIWLYLESNYSPSGWLPLELPNTSPTTLPESVTLHHQCSECHDYFLVKLHSFSWSNGCLSFTVNNSDTIGNKYIYPCIELYDANNIMIGQVQIYYPLKEEKSQLHIYFSNIDALNTIHINTLYSSVG